MHEFFTRSRRALDDADSGNSPQTFAKRKPVASGFPWVYAFSQVTRNPEEQRSIAEKPVAAKTDKGISPSTKSPLLTCKPWGLLHAVSLFESFHPAGRINQLLLAGKKGMAGGAYFSGNLRLG